MTSVVATPSGKELQLDHFHFEVDGHGTAVVLMDVQGQSMNTISRALADDLGRILERLESDRDIKSVVLGSAKPSGFLAGADIHMLTRMTSAEAAAEASRELQAGLARLENLHRKADKPVVAAIHGPCLGGGLELALAAAIRIVSSDEARTKLGQAEVKLGLIPGAGGTQRLPRLIGIAAAMDLILTGREVRPRRAKSLGLVDEVVPQGLLLEVAKERARQAVGKPAKGARSKGGVVNFLLEGNPLGRSVLFRQARRRLVAQTQGNYPAPEAALEVIRTGVQKGLEAGMAAEAAAFGRLSQSKECKALISIFLATQELSSDSGVSSPKVEVRPVRRVGILGGGLMGAGIATINATRAGVSSRIKDLDDSGIGRALAYVRKTLDRDVKRRRRSPVEADRLMHRVTGTLDYSGFGAVDLIIEAVFEDLELKRRILAEVEAVAPETTIFASNTSSLPIGRIAEAAQRPETVIGMHYFSPVEKMPLLEIIVTEKTADWVTATCVAFGKRQGKTVIVVNDGPGFYTSRILAPYMNEATILISEGARIEAVDRAMKDWGFPVGPITLIDEVGIDVGAKVAGVMLDAFGDRLTAPGGMEAILADNRLGRKNGRGFYRYEEGKKRGPDESVYALIGGRRKEYAREEIQARLALAFVNEAALCLQEGILREPRDGDIGAVFGLGFPPFRGGPFTYVDQLGAAEVVGRLEELAERHGDRRFAPAQILRDQAKAGSSFRS